MCGPRKNIIITLRPAGGLNWNARTVRCANGTASRTRSNGCSCGVPVNCTFLRSLELCGCVAGARSGLISQTWCVRFAQPLPLRGSFSGRTAVSKTADRGSIPRLRAYELERDDCNRRRNGVYSLNQTGISETERPMKSLSRSVFIPQRRGRRSE